MYRAPGTYGEVGTVCVQLNGLYFDCIAEAVSHMKASCGFTGGEALSYVRSLPRVELSLDEFDYRAEIRKATGGVRWEYHYDGNVFYNRKALLRYLLPGGTFREALQHLPKLATIFFDEKVQGTEYVTVPR